MTSYTPTTSIQDDVLIFLVSAPSPQQIIEFHASPAAQERLRYLLEANRQNTLTAEELAELDEAIQMGHFSP